MFDITATGKTAGVDWEHDKSRATVEIELEDLALSFKIQQGQPVTLKLTLSRHDIHYLWGNLDKDLIRERFRVQREGGESPMLPADAVERALQLVKNDA
jgi:hypothetical protein